MSGSRPRASRSSRPMSSASRRAIPISRRSRSITGPRRGRARRCSRKAARSASIISPISTACSSASARRKSLSSRRRCEACNAEAIHQSPGLRRLRLAMTGANALLAARPRRYLVAHEHRPRHAPAGSETMDQVVSKSRTWNPDKFRLRKLVDRLVDMGEVEIHEEPVALAEMSPMIEATSKALLFKKAGPEQQEVVGAVSASPRRLAAAFGVTEEKMREEYLRRVANPQKTFEVPSSEAPVHEVVQTGDQIDLTKLPFHIQHEYDGAPYISSGIDFTLDPLTRRSNVGCRRLMLRGKDKCGFNLTAPSDLKQIYLGCVARGEKLQASFTIGA